MSLKRTSGTILVTSLIALFSLFIAISLGIIIQFQNREANLAELNTANNLYVTGRFEEAAKAFRSFRSKGVADEKLRYDATTGELYSYRQLGHNSQEHGDIVTAVRWYQAALTLDPTDSQAQTEFSAAQRLMLDRETRSASLPVVDRPSDILSPDTGVNSSSLDSPSGDVGKASIRRSPFEQANAASAQKAWALYQQGEDAYRTGDLANASSLWRQAIGAGPGSPGAILAGEEIMKYGSHLLH